MTSNEGNRFHLRVAAVALVLTLLALCHLAFADDVEAAADEVADPPPAGNSEVRPIGVALSPDADIPAPRLPRLPDAWTPRLLGDAPPDLFFASSWGREWGGDSFIFPPREELPEETNRGRPPRIQWTWGEVHMTESNHLSLAPRDVPESARNLIALLDDNEHPRVMAPPPRSAARALRYRYGFFPHHPDPLLIRIIPPRPSFFVGIYAGRGSWEENVVALENFLEHYEIEHATFDGDDFDRLKRFDAIWFPGGFSAEYRAYVPDHEAIGDFVAEGGVYLGTCAGAYYAATTVVWDGESQEGATGLFSGSAIGPEASFGGWGNPTEIVDEEDTPFGDAGEDSREMYYMDGPYLVPERPEEVRVLARYAANGEAAVVAEEFGRGSVVLMGPHPEMGKDPESGEFDLEGGEGSHWPWLHDLVRWALARR
ncbi:MAG: BPL-N domain-containing protein [Bacillota bacterium]